MTHTQIRRRLERLERPRQPSRIVIRQVILIGEDEPDPPHEPGVKVIRVTLDTPSEKAEEGR
jgi:hypothetical protein